MKHEWQEVLKMTGHSDIIVERVRIKEKNIVIEGEFDLPQFSRLSMEEQTFIMAFLKCHGSIKEMESMFGISYPTVKNRLNRISEKILFVEDLHNSTSSDILSRLERGELTVDEAEKELKGN